MVVTDLEKIYFNFEDFLHNFNSSQFLSMILFVLTTQTKMATQNVLPTQTKKQTTESMYRISDHIWKINTPNLYQCGQNNVSFCQSLTKFVCWRHFMQSCSVDWFSLFCWSLVFKINWWTTEKNIQYTSFSTAYRFCYRQMYWKVVHTTLFITDAFKFIKYISYKPNLLILLPVTSSHIHLQWFGESSSPDNTLVYLHYSTLDGTLCSID